MVLRIFQICPTFYSPNVVPSLLFFLYRIFLHCLPHSHLCYNLCFLMLQTRIQITNLKGETTCRILKPVLFLPSGWVSNLGGRKAYQADLNLVPILQEGLSGYSTYKSRQSSEADPFSRETRQFSFHMNFGE